MILRSIFDAAIDNDLCYKNPVKNIKYRNAGKAQERSAYDKAQAEICEDYAQAHGRVDVVILLNTGVRRSELLGLKWSDIDFTKKTMNIRRGVTQTKGKIIIDVPKTPNSIRTIPLSNQFSEYLMQFRRSDECFVIGGNTEPMKISTYAKHFKRFMDAFAADKDIPALSPHELRHTYGTTLREGGVDIYTIQKVMGHSDISVTAAIYVHNDLEVLRREMKID